MLQTSIIQDTDSMFATPAFIVQKKNRSLRLIHDYVNLNVQTFKDGYPFPNVNDQIQGLKNMKFFSLVDLDSGFYQIPVRKEDRFKTAFTVPFGHFEYTRMPFELCNVPRTFQRTMNKALCDVETVRLFIDDILIISRSY